MKFYLLLFFLCVTWRVVYAQTIVDGYYITLNNDSLKGGIKVPKMIFAGVDIEKLERKIKSVDNNTQSFEKFKPNENFTKKVKNKLVK